MRKSIKIFIAVVAVLIIAAVVVPFLVPMDAYKTEIISQVKEKTGRDLTISGSMKASIFPVIGVEVNKVSLSSGAGYPAQNLLEVEKLNLKIGLGALLQKKLQVQKFILDKPLINLEVNEAGKPNWEFGAADNTADEKKEADQNSDKASLLAGLILGDVKISDGEINYHNARDKKSVSLKSLNLKASLPNLSSPFNLEGDAVWNNEKVTIKASAANPGEFAEGKTSPFTLDVKSIPVNLNYEGEASQDSAKGKIALNIPSIPSLVKWTGSNFDWKGSAPLAFAVNGNLAASPKSIVLDNSEITLDVTKLAGKLKVGLEDKVPDIEATFASEMLDLNPYIVKTSAEKTSWLISPAYAEEWSNQRIDLSALNSLNARLNLAFGNILYEKIKLGKTLINAQLDNGLLKFSIPSLNLYGGEAKVNATLSSDGGFSKQATLSNINSGELIRDASGNERFSGTLNGAINLNGKLTSMLDAMRSLNGDGNFKVNEGAIKGIDLENMVRNVPTAFNNVNNLQQVTRFDDISGTFTISRGILSNKDLAIKTEAVNLAGQGTVDLAQKTVNYRLNPAFAAREGKQGLEVPVLVQGPFSNLRFTPDLAGIIKNTIENPAALKNTVDSVKDQLKEMKGGGKDAVKGVQDLLKGFRQ